MKQTMDQYVASLRAMVAAPRMTDYERRRPFFRDTVRLFEESGRELLTEHAKKLAKSLLPDGDYLVRYEIAHDDLGFTPVKSTGGRVFKRYELLEFMQWP